ncbi:DUF1080 domain-containing protein [uncultured Polaribacter sp.]|uniref:3-keto-disaccharide hydrolase n=1 Tax=uncultured Polaribacter sp. TaxID=174711 RepID=UPI00262399E0|nr:DUF1080 domain-containing protein [uncultured Polaribacter sp.]
MKKKIINAILTTILSATITSAIAQDYAQTKIPYPKTQSKDWKNLLNDNLSAWEVWTGIPHFSVSNLPKGYKKNATGKNTEPLGLGDSMGIYKVVKDNDGKAVLNISGAVFAVLSTKEIYSNYHMTMLFKWGDKKYAPRKNAKRDSGLLYHCHGNHGAFKNVWKSSLEFQIQEGDFGDLYVLGGTYAKAKANDKNRWDPQGTKISKSAKRSVDNESSYGEWTRLDLYVIKDTAIHVVNGVVVLALVDAKAKNGTKLEAGQIQIQSEGAECFAKDISIRPIKRFPREIKKLAGL